MTVCDLTVILSESFPARNARQLESKDPEEV